MTRTSQRPNLLELFAEHHLRTKVRSAQIASRLCDLESSEKFVVAERREFIEMLLSRTLRLPALADDPLRYSLLW